MGVELEKHVRQFRAHYAMAGNKSAGIFTSMLPGGTSLVASSSSSSVAPPTHHMAVPPTCSSAAACAALEKKFVNFCHIPAAK